MKRRKPEPARPVSLTKALLAGVAGGLAGSLAKSYAEHLFPPPLDPPAPQATADDHHQPPPTVSEAAGLAAQADPTLNWGFGTLIGGVYGVVAELQPETTAWAGIPFGLTVNRVAHKQLLPAMGLIDPAARQPVQRRMSNWTSYLAYGLATEVVRRAIRKRL